MNGILWNYSKWGCGMTGDECRCKGRIFSPLLLSANPSIKTVVDLRNRHAGTYKIVLLEKQHCTKRGVETAYSILPFVFLFSLLPSLSFLSLFYLFLTFLFSLLFLFLFFSFLHYLCVFLIPAPQSVLKPITRSLAQYNTSQGEKESVSSNSIDKKYSYLHGHKFCI
jgi:hypothetical protein